jgi:hypothetical protein
MCPVGGEMKASRLPMVAFALIIGSAQPVFGLSLIEYKKLQNVSSQNLDFYLFGLLDGLTYANLTLERKKQPPLYCAPKKPPLDIHDFKELLDKQIKQYQAAASPVEVMALYTLRKAFPCKKQSPTRER